MPTDVGAARVVAGRKTGWTGVSVSETTDYAALPLREAKSVVDELVDPAGKRVLDVGCGDGRWLPHFAARGARLTGIDISGRKVAAARALNIGEIEIGDAASLRFADATFGIVLFMNSLHHVPADDQLPALIEAVRVLEPGGAVLILEPIAAGASYEVRKPIDDETDIRASALAAIRAVVGDGHAENASEFMFTTEKTEATFDDFVDGFLAADPQARRPIVDANRVLLAERFERFGRKTDQGRVFDQPYRASLLRKRSAPGPDA